MLGLIILVVFVLVVALVAKRLSTTMVTAPMLFIAFGFLLSKLQLFDHQGVDESLHLVAEIALILLLFLDAAKLDVAALRRRHTWPVRMLVIGLPLTILFGTLAAWVFVPGWPLVALALLASILAPTDAALGDAVISNPAVPERARRALTVESGVNDGLALPAVLLFASLTAQVSEPNAADWLIFGGMQLLLGPLVGAATGLAGGFLVMRAHDHNFSSEPFEGIGVIALAGIAYLLATLVGGNGFISAFVAGLGFGYMVKGGCKFVYEFTEGEGQLLSWGAFFLIGLVLVPEAISHLTWPILAMILVSLFVVRPFAIWVSLIGTDASWRTRLFFGWFGPRGLATALFALLILQQIDHDFGKPILMIAINAVWISALLHGLSAAPGAKWFAARCGPGDEFSETEPASTSAMPLITKEH
jgi:NhaP-type Na+/H+ or K+/H+ antiporter